MTSAHELSPPALIAVIPVRPETSTGLELMPVGLVVVVSTPS